MDLSPAGPAPESTNVLLRATAVPPHVRREWRVVQLVALAAVVALWGFCG